MKLALAFILFAVLFASSASAYTIDSATFAGMSDAELFGVMAPAYVRTELTKDAVVVHVNLSKAEYRGGAVVVSTYPVAVAVQRSSFVLCLQQSSFLTCWNALMFGKTTYTIEANNGSVSVVPAYVQLLERQRIFMNDMRSLRSDLQAQSLSVQQGFTLPSQEEVLG